ncbi:OmpH family outer membrane protein [Flavobacterium aestivum]|uniref:OmpH family outer membrane protein n=1 Tax=Flavobacterium aestivum TaxID=3003257 RepID=UPI0032C3DD76
MRKHILFIILLLIVTTTISAQTKGNKVGYIDMEYILQNVPNYIEAKTQLEEKAQKWKQEIEAKKIEINKLTDALKAEKPLLTSELIEERETEIKFLENEKLDYQQKRFGPNGDLITQKAGLVKPIQDQIFTAVQDIAEAKKYDFIFDKSSHLTILFAAKRFDISDQVIRMLNRTEKREQLTKKQLKEEEEKEKKEDAIDENPALAEREKALEDRKTAREKLIETKRLAQEETKRQYEERRKQLLAEREAKKNGTVVAKTPTEASSPNGTVDKTETAKPSAQEEQKRLLEEKRKKILEEREAAKKALEEKRAKELADREAKKNNFTPTTGKVNETTEKAADPNNATAKPSTEFKPTTEETKTDAQEERKKALEEKRKKILEEREAAKKALEEKRLKEIEEKAALKKANEDKLKENK